VPPRDNSEAARALFADLLSVRGLAHERDDDAPVDVLWRIPVQPGLSVPMTFGLQNADELNLGIGQFWSYLFPFENAQADFRRLALGFIDGKCRVCEWRRRGVLYKRTLEEPAGDAWRVAYTDFTRPLPVLFGAKSVDYITNTAAAGRSV